MPQHQLCSQGPATQFGVLEFADFSQLLLGWRTRPLASGSGHWRVRGLQGKNSKVPVGPCWPSQPHQMAVGAHVAHTPSVPMVWKPSGGTLASILRTVVAMGPLVVQTFHQVEVWALWPSQEPGLFFSLTGPVGLTRSCSPLCRHHFFQREGASFLPSTYFQLSYILHKVNLANREHSENIFGFETSVL